MSTEQKITALLSAQQISEMYKLLLDLPSEDRRKQWSIKCLQNFNKGDEYSYNDGVDYLKIIEKNTKWLTLEIKINSSMSTVSVSDIDALSKICIVVNALVLISNKNAFADIDRTIQTDEWHQLDKSMKALYNETLDGLLRGYSCNKFATLSMIDIEDSTVFVNNTIKLSLANRLIIVSHKHDKMYVELQDNSIPSTVSSSEQAATLSLFALIANNCLSRHDSESIMTQNKFMSLITTSKRLKDLTKWTNDQSSLDVLHNVKEDIMHVLTSYDNTQTFEFMLCNNIVIADITHAFYFRIRRPTRVKTVLEIFTTSPNNTTNMQKIVINKASSQIQYVMNCCSEMISAWSLDNVTQNC